MNSKGFTLIEVLAVLVILSMAALIVMPSIKNVDKTKDSAFASSAKIITSKAGAMHSNDKYKNNSDLFIENKIYLKNIIGIGNIKDPYGGEFDKEKSYVLFKTVTENDIQIEKVYIYLKSCTNKTCHLIGTANNPISDDELTYKDVKEEEK